MDGSFECASESATLQVQREAAEDILIGDFRGVFERRPAGSPVGAGELGNEDSVGIVWVIHQAASRRRDWKRVGRGSRRSQVDGRDEVGAVVASGEGDTPLFVGGELVVGVTGV